MLRCGNPSSRKEEVINKESEVRSQESGEKPRRRGFSPRWAAVLAAFASLGLAAPPPLESQNYQAHVAYLASPELKGRYTGSPELEKAATYIANQFKSFGLRPAGGKDYEQPFTVTIKAHLGGDNRLRIDDAGKKSELISGRDYVPSVFPLPANYRAAWFSRATVSLPRTCIMTTTPAWT
jgi:hypothetical protein